MDFNTRGSLVWQTLASLPFSLGKIKMEAVNGGRKVYAFGSAVVRYDLASNIWTQASIDTMPCSVIDSHAKTIELKKVFNRLPTIS